MPPKIADAIRILAAETLEGCSNDWSDSAKADEVLRAVYDLIFEAGVQAERERFERQFMESLLTRRAAPSWILGREPSKPLNEDNLTVEQGFWLDVRAALAVVTGKEGASDE